MLLTIPLTPSLHLLDNIRAAFSSLIQKLKTPEVNFLHVYLSYTRSLLDVRLPPQQNEMVEGQPVRCKVVALASVLS